MEKNMQKHTHLSALLQRIAAPQKSTAKKIGWKLPEGLAAPPEKDALLP